MGLVPAKCTMCGSSIKVDDSSEKGICEHCGTEYITEKVINNYTTNYNTVHNITNNVTKIINGKEVDDGEDEFNRGLVHLKTKKYDQARRRFDKAIGKSPEVAKYYFYWCIAESENFTNLNVFMGCGTIYYSDEGEDTHDIESFFALATKEECEALSKEYNIDLNNGIEGLVAWCFDRFEQEPELVNSFDFYHIWVKVIGKLKKGNVAYNKVLDFGKKYVAKLAMPLWQDIKRGVSLENINKDTRQKVATMIDFMLKNGLHPNAGGKTAVSAYDKDAIELAVKLDEDAYRESEIKSKKENIESFTRALSATATSGVNKYKEKIIDTGIASSVVVFIVVAIIAYFVKVYLIYNSDTYVRGQTDIIGAPLLPAVIAGAIGALVTFAGIYVYFMILAKREAKDAKKRLETLAHNRKKMEDNADNEK